jgi:hypothetical protein
MHFFGLTLIIIDVFFIPFGLELSMPKKEIIEIMLLFLEIAFYLYEHLNCDDSSL